MTLLATVPEAAARAAVKETAWYLGLFSCYDMGCSPPELGLLAGRERGGWQAEGDLERVWSP